MLKKKLFKGISFILLAFVFSYVSSIINAEAQMVCYAGSGGGGGSGVTDIFGGLTGSVFSSATPANNTVLVGTSSTGAKWAALANNQALAFVTSSNTFTQATCAMLSGSASSCSTDTTNASNISSGTLTGIKREQIDDTITSSATPTPVATDDQFNITALAAGATFGAPSGSPVADHKLVIRIKDNATPQSLSWNAIYRASSDLALPTTTITSKTLYVGFIYNADDSKWDFVSLLNKF